MKAKYFLLLVLLIAHRYTYGQTNLVKNPSFETYWRCPIWFDEIKFANYWSPIDSTTYPALGDTFGQPNCTPELCHTCCTHSESSVPINARFVHYPRTGKGMAQVVMYNSDTTSNYQRDYLQGHLIGALIAGKQYCVTFYTVQEHTSCYHINNIGAYLDDGAIDTTTQCGLPEKTHFPQVFETAIISDTINWTKVQGSFIANGTEKYITIGNFFDFDHTSATLTHYAAATAFGNTILSFYLIDDVSVIPIDAVANAGVNVVISTTAGDSAFIGTSGGYLPCKWYKNGTLIDSNTSGFKVKPTTTSTYVMELDVCGTITRDSVVVSVWPSAIMSYELGMMNVRVYPNPATNEVTVEGAKGCDVEFYDVVGRKVACLSGRQASYLPMTEKEVMDISKLPKGVYMVRVIDKATRYSVTKQFLKE